MSKREALLVMLAAVLMLTAAATWKYGAYGLGGSGAALLLLLGFVRTEKGVSDGPQGPQ